MSVFYACMCVYLYFSEVAPPSWESKYVQNVGIEMNPFPITLQCLVLVIPTPSVSWLRNGIPLEESESVCM